jgi:hypothetical protein
MLEQMLACGALSPFLIKCIRHGDDLEEMCNTLQAQLLARDAEIASMARNTKLYDLMCMTQTKCKLRLLCMRCAFNKWRENTAAHTSWQEREALIEELQEAQQKADSFTWRVHRDAQEEREWDASVAVREEQYEEVMCVNREEALLSHAAQESEQAEEASALKSKCAKDARMTEAVAAAKKEAVKQASDTGGTKQTVAKQVLTFR